MNAKRVAVCAAALLLVPAAVDARGGGGFRGGGGGGGFRGGSMSRPSASTMSRPSTSTMSRPSGGFDMHNDAPGTNPGGSYSHSSTGAYGTQRSTNVTNTGSGYNRTTTATNGNYNRTSTGSANNGVYSHSSTASNGYGSHQSSSTANANTGNYSRTASGSNPNGSYSSQASGNVNNGTYNRNTSASNKYGQSYNGSVNANNGNVNVNRTVNNPVYSGYPAWGWNAGVAWYPAPYYWGGGFWGAMAIGATSAVVYGEIVSDNETVTSYEAQPDSPGAKLLSNYKLTQTPCGPPNLVVIYGPNKSAICAKPNDLVAAGNYTVDSSTLTLVSKSS